MRQTTLLYSILAHTHLMDLRYQSGESPGISFAQANKNIKKALELNDEDEVAHLALAQLYQLRKKPDKAIAAYERTIAMYPNGFDAYAGLGALFIFTGEPEEGVLLIEKAIRLNPVPPDHYLNFLGSGYYLLGRYEEAIEVQKKTLERSSENLWAHICLTAAYSASDREEEAHHQAKELLRVDPTFSLDKFSEMLPLKDKAEVERYIAFLRKAGLK